MSLTTQVLLALLAGFALGIPLAGADASTSIAVIGVLDPIGTIFINAIRMTVIPLVVSSLIVGVTSAPDTRAVGRIGARAFVLFVALLSAATWAGVLIGEPLLALFPLDPEAVESLRASAASLGSDAAERASQVPTMSQWIVALVPANPIKAAADGAMLPLIVATLAFSVALMRISDERRTAVVGIVQGVMDASLALVGGILALAPIGVFALAVPLAARMGLSALAALASYVAIVSGICILFMVVLLYPLAVTVGRIPLRDFARAALPAQMIAFSSRSSLAALPAMLSSVTHTLRLPPVIASFFIPLASSMFRVGAGIGQTVGVLFIARLYGVDLGAAQMVSIALTATVTSFSAPGIPGGSIFVMVPVLMSAGIPIEGVGILLGADTIPDMFRTTANVTGHMSAAAILARGEKAEA